MLLQLLLSTISLVKSHLKRVSPGKFSFTFNSVRVNELNEKAPANIVLTLVGNKCDLAS